MAVTFRPTLDQPESHKEFVMDMIDGVVVLVCGGRDFDNRDLVTSTLDRIHRERTIKLLIHGAANGADQLANDWAVAAQVSCQSYPADWLKLGRAAGPARNKQMLVEGKPHLVVAFPGGRGTANMVRQAKQMGVEVMQVP